MFFDKINSINTFILDVDGVLTDGTVLALASGEQARTFLVKDGFAIERALAMGFNICIITGGFQDGVRKRLEFLGIKDIFMNVKNKVEIFHKYLNDKQINPDNVLYMGDDVPDYEVMMLCGLKACPSDAAVDIIQISDFVSAHGGGRGAVREVLETVLKAQNKWPLQNINANG